MMNGFSSAGGAQASLQPVDAATSAQGARSSVSHPASVGLRWDVGAMRWAIMGRRRAPPSNNGWESEFFTRTRKPRRRAVSLKPTVATTPDHKPSIAPIVGPDDPRRFTDSGIEIKNTYTEEDVAPGLEERLGAPGEYPYTRGVHPDMYRGRKWTMRQYAGYASAKETNERFHYLIEHGSTGLSMAFDLPTQLGRDSDDPLCEGEVGRTGVAIDSIDDMRRVFDGIPLDQVSTSMTINAPAAVLLLLYELVGEEQGVPVGGSCAARRRTTSSRSTSPAGTSSTRPCRRCG